MYRKYGKVAAKRERIAYSEALKKDVNCTTPKKILELADTLREVAMQMIPHKGGDAAMNKGVDTILGQIMCQTGRVLMDKAFDIKKQNLMETWKRLIEKKWDGADARRSTKLFSFEEYLKEVFRPPEHTALPWKSKLPIDFFRHILSFNRSTRVLFGVVYSCKILATSLCSSDSNHMAENVVFRAIYTRPPMSPSKVLGCQIFTKIHVHSLSFPNLRKCYYELTQRSPQKNQKLCARPERRNCHRNPMDCDDSDWALERNTRVGRRKHEKMKYARDVFQTGARVSFTSLSPLGKFEAICNYVQPLMLCNLTRVDFGSVATNCLIDNLIPLSRCAILHRDCENLREHVKFLQNLKASGCDITQLDVIFSLENIRPIGAPHCFEFINHVAQSVKYVGLRVTADTDTGKKMPLSPEALLVWTAALHSEVRNIEYDGNFYSYNSPEFMIAENGAIIWIDISRYKRIYRSATAEDPLCAAKLKEPWFMRGNSKYIHRHFYE
jgi:hypothetical protein